MIEIDELRNTLVEAMNSRDPELFDELGVGDPGSLQEVIETANEEFPRMMMTNGDINGVPVAVVWMPDESDRYRVVAHIELVTEGADAHATLVDGVDPNLVAEAPAGETVAEWEVGIEDTQGDDKWV
jgi:hypothetical protein